MMIRKVYYTLMICFVLSIQYAIAQTAQGGNPSGLNWHIMTSPSVRVIYPQGMESQAQRVSGLINYMDINNRMSIGDKKRRLDIVLQNQTINANGYVSLAPFRSEFFSTPPASNTLLGSVDWLDLLAIHEYRHALQFLNGRKGITNLAYYLGGETLWSALMFMSVPNWYFEGDAVIMETALSPAGRGRSPFFTLQQRALAIEGSNFSYNKHRNGSFKSLLPNHYTLGYMMLTKARKEKGNNITAEVLNRAVEYKGLIYPFSKAMQKMTGYSTPKLYYSAWEDAKKDFKAQLSNTSLIPTNYITPKANRTVSNYRFPIMLENGNIVARKTSYSTTDEIVLITEKGEEKLTNIGFNDDRMLQHSMGKLTWTELSKSARRDNKDFSNIVTYDIATGSKNYLTQDSKYFSPSISPNGDKIAAIHISPNQKNEIHIVDINTGAVLKKMSTPLNYFLSRTTWSSDGQSIITIAKHQSQLALIKFSLTEENTMTELTNWTSHTMETPIVKDEKVYFNAGFTGIDNIFYTDINGSKNIYQVSSVAVGAFDPYPTNIDEILFTEFTNMGYVISKQKLSDNLGLRSNTSIVVTEPIDMPIYQSVANQSEGGNILNKDFTSTAYSSKPYNGLFRGMRLHSWSLIPNGSDINLNISMNNLMDDISLGAGMIINLNEGNSTSYNTNLTIARYFPVISLVANQSNRQTDFYTSANTLTNQKFKETSLGAEIAVPLSWIKGDYATRLRPKIGLYNRQLNDVVADANVITDDNFLDFQAGLQFSSIRRTAFQNVGPRLGVALGINYANAFNASNSNKISSRANLFLPGIGKNHSIELSGSFQKEKLNNPYQYIDLFEYARGYGAPINDEFRLFTADYRLPLLYPDFGVNGLFFLKRIRTNLFYDYGIGENNTLNKSTTYNSTGAEIIFDVNLLNIAPVSIGPRITRLLTEDPRIPGKKMDIGLYVGIGF
jgi:hypothetical protein